MVMGLVGRDDELRAVAGVLHGLEELPRAVVLSGEAGIGKTSLWSAGLDAAEARGYRVLRTRPGEAETGFAFAGLTDLLEGAAADVLPELPSMQRRAIETALLLRESEFAVDERAVASAFLGALRILARDASRARRYRRSPVARQRHSRDSSLRARPPRRPSVSLPCSPFADRHRNGSGAACRSKGSSLSRSVA